MAKILVTAVDGEDGCFKAQGLDLLPDHAVYIFRGSGFLYRLGGPT